MHLDYPKILRLYPFRIAARLYTLASRLCRKESSKEAIQRTQRPSEMAVPVLCLQPLVHAKRDASGSHRKLWKPPQL